MGNWGYQSSPKLLTAQPGKAQTKLICEVFGVRRHQTHEDSAGWQGHSEAGCETAAEPQGGHRAVIQPQLAGRGKQGAPAEVIGGKFHAKGKQLPAATRQNNYM